MEVSPVAHALKSSFVIVILSILLGAKTASSTAPHTRRGIRRAILIDAGGVGWEEIASSGLTTETWSFTGNATDASGTAFGVASSLATGCAAPGSPKHLIVDSFGHEGGWSAIAATSCASDPSVAPYITRNASPNREARPTNSEAISKALSSGSRRIAALSMPWSAGSREEIETAAAEASTKTLIIKPDDEAREEPWLPKIGCPRIKPATVVSLARKAWDELLSRDPRGAAPLLLVVSYQSLDQALHSGDFERIQKARDALAELISTCSALSPDALVVVGSHSTSPDTGRHADPPVASPVLVKLGAGAIEEWPKPIPISAVSKIFVPRAGCPTLKSTHAPASSETTYPAANGDSGYREKISKGGSDHLVVVFANPRTRDTFPRKLSKERDGGDASLLAFMLYVGAGFSIVVVIVAATLSTLTVFRRGL